MKLSDFIKSIDSSSKNIIYFGGSFNPWHEGHAECLRKAPKESLKIVIPDHNPLKEFSQREIGLEIKELKCLNENIFIYDEFFKTNKKNPTINWLASTKEELPDYSHSLLMGYDSYKSLNKWQDYKEILTNLSSLYVLNRENVDVEQLYEMETIFLGPHQFEHLSSSNLREN